MDSDDRYPRPLNTKSTIMEIPVLKAKQLSEYNVPVSKHRVVMRNDDEVPLITSAGTRCM